MEIPAQVSVEDAARTREERDDCLVVDVREPDELEIAALTGEDVVSMPLSSLGEGNPDAIPERVREHAGPMLVMCHHGVRSLKAALWLRQQGVEQAQSIEGGIDAYSLKVDPTVPRY